MAPAGSTDLGTVATRSSSRARGRRTTRRRRRRRERPRRHHGRSGVALQAAPTFRFSRARARRARSSPRRSCARSRSAMTRRRQPRGQDPGRLHLPRPVRRPRPHLRQDPGRVRRPASRRPTLLQGRSPTLDLDSLYGAGPLDPVSAEFYEADQTRLKVGKTTQDRHATWPGSASTYPASGTGSAAGASARRTSPTCATTRTSPSPSTTPR